MRKYLLSLIILTLVVPMFGFAADLRTAEVITKEESPKNLYLAGENPTVDAHVAGDLVVAGGVVAVNGDVENNVVAAGSTLSLNGKVGGNVRVVGGTVNIESSIGGDLVVFGGDVILGTKSVVSGDLLVFGGTVTMKGEVVGSVKKCFAGDVVIAGKVGGNVDIANVGNLRLDSTAQIAGSLRYTSKNEGNIASSAQVGGNVEYTKLTTTNMRGRHFGPDLGSILFGALTAFITVLVFIRLFPKSTLSVLNDSLVNPWAKMGVGFLTMVVTPIVLFLLLLTFVGWGVMGYIFLAYTTFFALTGTLAAVLAGSVAWKYLRKETELTLSWQTVAIGVLLMALLKLIPVIGWVIALMIALIIFGTLFTKSLAYIKAERA